MEASKTKMGSEKPRGFEYRHIKCAEGAVNAVMRQHGLFWWELVGTTTVCSCKRVASGAGYIYG